MKRAKGRERILHRTPSPFLYTGRRWQEMRERKPETIRVRAVLCFGPFVRVLWLRSIEKIESIGGVEGGRLLAERRGGGRNPYEFDGLFRSPPFREEGVRETEGGFCCVRDTDFAMHSPPSARRIRRANHAERGRRNGGSVKGPFFSLLVSLSLAKFG